MLNCSIGRDTMTYMDKTFGVRVVAQDNGSGTGHAPVRRWSW